MKYKNTRRKLLQLGLPKQKIDNNIKAFNVYISHITY